jgi:hypothetical protein
VVKEDLTRFFFLSVGANIVSLYSFANARFHRKEDQDPEVVRIVVLFVMECAQMIVHQPIETCCVVFNMEGFTLANMVSSRQVMDVSLIPFSSNCICRRISNWSNSCLSALKPTIPRRWALVSFTKHHGYSPPVSDKKKKEKEKKGTGYHG